MSGVFYGVGTGPGDPDLMTLKAARLVVNADVVAFLQNSRGGSMARDIACAHIDPAAQLYPLVLDCDRNRKPALKVYARAAEEFRTFVCDGKNVVFLCEGDPFFYGSFIYLYEHLCSLVECSVVPGVTSVSAVAAAAGRPLVRLDQSLRVVTAAADDRTLVSALEQSDAVAIMKVGSHLPRLQKLLLQTGRCGDATYVENATRAEQKVIHDCEQLERVAGTYFSMLLVCRPPVDAER